MATSKEMELAIKIAGKVDRSLSTSLSIVGTGIAKTASVMTKAITATTGALTALGTKAVSIGKEYEAALSQIQATLHLDKESEDGIETMKIIEDSVRSLGKTTAFTATEAAEGFNILAMAGYDAQTAAASLPSALRLAGAGAMSIEAAAGYLAGGMAELKIDKTEANFQHFADAMAVIATKAKTDVAGIGDAILQVGTTGSYLAGGMDEAFAWIGVLANYTKDGNIAEAGTHLRNIIMSLMVPRSDDAAYWFEELGVSAFDAAGNLRSLQDIFRDLDTAMAGWTTEEKMTAISDMFKLTDRDAVGALLTDYTGAFDNLYDAAKNASEGTGAAAEMYGTQIDNLNGDMAILNSALEDLGISFYQDVQPALRDTTKSATEMVGTLASAYEEGGLDGLSSAVGDVLATATSAVAETAPTVVNTASGVVQGFIDGVSDNSEGIAGAGAAILAALGEGVVDAMPDFLLTAVSVVDDMADAIADRLPTLIDQGTAAVAQFATGIANQQSSTLTTGRRLVSSIVTAVIRNAPTLLNSGILVIASIILGIEQFLPVLATEGIRLLYGLVNAVLQNLPTIISSGAQIGMGVVMGLVQILPLLAVAGMDIIMQLVNGILPYIPALLEVGASLLINLITGLAARLPMLLSMGMSMIFNLVNGVLTMLPSLVDVGGQLLINIISGIIQNIPAILATGWMLLTQFVDGITSNLHNLLIAGVNIIIAIGSGLARAIPTLVAQVPGLLLDLVKGVLSIDWLQLGKDIINTILRGIIGFDLDDIDFELPFSFSADGKDAAAAAAGAQEELPRNWEPMVDYSQYKEGDTVPGVAEQLQPAPTMMSYEEMAARQKEAQAAQKQAELAQKEAAAQQALSEERVNKRRQAVTYKEQAEAVQEATAAVQETAAAVENYNDAAANASSYLPSNWVQSSSELDFNAFLEAGALSADEFSTSYSDKMASYNYVPTTFDSSSVLQQFGLLGEEGGLAYTNAVDDSLAGARTTLMDSMQQAINDAPTINTDLEINTDGITEAFAAAGQNGVDLFKLSTDAALENVTIDTSFAGSSDLLGDLETAMSATGESGGAALIDGISSALENNAAIDTTSLVSSLLDVNFDAMAGANGIEVGQSLIDALNVGINTALEGYDLSTRSIGLNTGALVRSMSEDGVVSGQALIDGITAAVDSGLQEYDLTAAEIGLDVSSLVADVISSGSTSGESMASSIISAAGAGLSGASIDTAGVAVDMTSVTNNVESAGTDAGEHFTAALADVVTLNTEGVTTAASALATAVATELDTGFGEAQDIVTEALSNMYTTIDMGAQDAAAAVKSAFENMSITIPRPRIPVITVGSDSVAVGSESVSVPNFTVSWNAAGGIFNQPTILGSSAGLQGVGEAGPEAILPLNSLWEQMRAMFSDFLQGGQQESSVDRLLSSIAGINDGSRQAESAMVTTDNETITFAPVYNLYGSATAEDADRAGKASFEEFKRFMQKWEHDKKRTRF